MGYAGPPFGIFAERYGDQLNVELRKTMEWVETSNSESAPNCPTRIEIRSSTKFCCNQSSFIRTVGRPAILLTVKMLPTCSAEISWPLSQYHRVENVAPRHPSNF